MTDAPERYETRREFELRKFAGAYLGQYVATPLPATVTHLIDGDTFAVQVPAWANTPFEMIKLRIAGIDTPESEKPPAKCKAEVALGKAAQAFAATLIKPGDQVTFTFTSFDKYGSRIDATVRLADGRDWAATMIAGKFAVAYSGGAKRNWCKLGPPT